MVKMYLCERMVGALDIFHIDFILVFKRYIAAIDYMITLCINANSHGTSYTHTHTARVNMFVSQMNWQKSQYILNNICMRFFFPNRTDYSQFESNVFFYSFSPKQINWHTAEYAEENPCYQKVFVNLIDTCRTLAIFNISPLLYFSKQQMQNDRITFGCHFSASVWQKIDRMVGKCTALHCNSIVLQLERWSRFGKNLFEISIT